MAYFVRQRADLNSPLNSVYQTVYYHCMPSHVLRWMVKKHANSSRLHQLHVMEHLCVMLLTGQMRSAPSLQEAATAKTAVNINS